MKQLLNILLMAAMTVGLGMAVTSCKDDKDDTNNNNNGGGEQTEAQYEQELQGWGIITQLSDERKAPDGWQAMTFEPTIGTPKEGEPYTRIVQTNDVATAASRYSDLIGVDMPAENIGFNYTIEDFGSLVYKRGSENGEYLAQVTVDIKQMPHLKKILYQTEQQAGLNATVNGTAYYRFGDVVKDKAGEYWICVRPSFGLEGKGESHWISVTKRLPEANLYKYTYKGTTWSVPTGLGCSKEHTQNLAELLYAMLKPAQWQNALAGSPKPAMFHDFSTSRIKYHNQFFWQRVRKAWDENNLFQVIFNMTSDKLGNKLTSEGINLLYNGYSWYTTTSWNCSLFEAAYKNGTGKLANMHDATYTKPTKRMENLKVDFSNSEKSVNGDFFENDTKNRFIVRYKTGKQLSSNGVYEPKTALSGCTPVYVYNSYYYQDTPNKFIDMNENPEIATEPLSFGFFAPGTVIVDEAGSRWLCYLSWLDMEGVPCGGGNNAYFISFDNINSATENTPWSAAGTFCSNEDLIDIDYAKPLAFLLCDMAFQKTSDKVELREICKENLGVDLTDLFVRRDTLFNSGSSLGSATIYATNIALGPNSKRTNGSQPYLRYVNDGTGMGNNRIDLDQDEKYPKHQFYRHYTDTKRELDLTEVFKPSGFETVYPDKWSICKRMGTNYRDTCFTQANCYKNNYAWTYFKYDTTVKSWPYTVNTGYGTRPQYVTPYWEPVIFVRHMILTDNSDTFKGVYNGKKFTLYEGKQLDPNNKTILQSTIWGAFGPANDRTWLDGVATRMINMKNGK